MSNAGDEIATEHGAAGRKRRVPPDQSWATYTLNARARWHDGKPVTPEDVIFSFNIMMDKGHPGLRAYYASVKGVEKVGERKVKFIWRRDQSRASRSSSVNLPSCPSTTGKVEPLTRPH